MNCWLNFNFEPIISYMPTCKNNLYIESVIKECPAGVIGDRISKRTAKVSSLDNSNADGNQNGSSQITPQPLSVEKCNGENIFDVERASENKVVLTPSPLKFDKCELMLVRGLLAITANVQSDLDLTPPPDTGIEN